MEFLRRAKSKKVNLLNIPSYVIRWIEQESQNDDSLVTFKAFIFG